MGTWALPDTKKKALQLEELMQSPIEARTAEEIIYNLLGDDELGDEIDNIAMSEGGHTDVRPEIACRLNEFVEDYALRPEAYNFKWRLGAIAICNKIIKKFISD